MLLCPEVHRVTKSGEKDAGRILLSPHWFPTLLCAGDADLRTESQGPWLLAAFGQKGPPNCRARGEGLGC